MSHVLVRATLVAALFGTASLSAIHPVAAQTDPATDPDYQRPDPKVYKTESDRAREYNTRARKAYDLGKFQKAVDLYTKAYEELPDGAFLFNIAQSYRQLDNCKQSLFFYKRFLSVKKDIPPATRSEVEGHIVVLEECVKKQDDIRNRPPDNISDPDGPGRGGGGTPTGGGGTPTGGGGTPTGGGGTTTNGGGGGTPTDGGGTPTGGGGDGGGGGDPIRVGTGGTDGGGDDGQIDAPIAPVDEAGPKVLVARLGVGAALPTFGDLPIDAPAQLSLSLGVGYPLKLGSKLLLDIGPTVGYTSVPWSMGPAVSGRSNLIALVGNVGVTYAAASKIDVRVDVGGGVLLFDGLEMGNPFTIGGRPATGALTMPHLRVALSGEYRLSNKLAVQVTPIAFGYSPPKTGLRDVVNSLTQLQFTVGVAYRQ